MNAISGHLKAKPESVCSKIRTQVVFDVMTLARGQQLSYKIALGVLDYLSKETDYFPWYTAFHAFDYLLTRLGERSNIGLQLTVINANYLLIIF